MPTESLKIDAITQELTAGLSLAAVGLLARVSSLQWRRQMAFGAQVSAQDVRALCVGSSNQETYRRAMDELMAAGLIEQEDDKIFTPLLQPEIEKAQTRIRNRKNGWEKRKGLPSSMEVPTPSAQKRQHPPKTASDGILVLGTSPLDDHVAVEIPCKSGRVGVTLAYIEKLKEAFPRINTLTKQSVPHCGPQQIQQKRKHSVELPNSSIAGCQQHQTGCPCSTR